MKRDIFYDTFPIFITSKNRPECKTAEFLRKEGIEFKIVIEPQDIGSYKHWGKNFIIILKENDKGIAYARNSVFEYCAVKKMDWCWLMDDDLSSFYKVVGKRNVRCSWKEISEAVEPQLRKSNKIAQASLEYQQYSWSSNKKPRINSYNDCYVAVKTSVLRLKKIKCDETLQLKVDRDLALQILSSGFNNVRFTKYAFGGPENGSNKGGLHEVYSKKSIERLMAFKMEEKWGTDICHVVIKKSGRIDASVNWKYFKR